MVSPMKRVNSVIRKDLRQESSTSIGSLRMEGEDKSGIFNRESFIKS